MAKKCKECGLSLSACCICKEICCICKKKGKESQPLKALAIRKKHDGEIVLGDYYYQIFPENHKHMVDITNVKHFEIIEVEITPIESPEPKGEVGKCQHEGVEKPSELPCRNNEKDVAYCIGYENCESYKPSSDGVTSEGDD